MVSDLLLYNSFLYFYIRKYVCFLKLVNLQLNYRHFFSGHLHPNLTRTCLHLHKLLFLLKLSARAPVKELGTGKRGAERL
jgi:hypothetical protein